MLVAKVQNGIVTQVADCRELCEWYPPTDEQLADRGLVKVNTFRQYDAMTQKLVPCNPLIEGEWVYTVAVEDMIEEDIQAAKTSALANIRSQRNRLLSECDWTQLADSTADKTAWAEYRQALRDLPSTILEPRTFADWPHSPDWVEPKPLIV